MKRTRVAHYTKSTCTLDGETMCICRAEEPFVRAIGKIKVGDLEREYDGATQYNNRQSKYKADHEHHTKATSAYIEAKRASIEQLQEMRKMKRDQIVQVGQDPEYNCDAELLRLKRAEIAAEVLAIERDLVKMGPLPEQREYHPLPILLFSCATAIVGSQLEFEWFELRLEDESDEIKLVLDGEREIEFDNVRKSIGLFTSMFVTYNYGRPDTWIKGNQEWFHILDDYRCPSTTVIPGFEKR